MTNNNHNHNTSQDLPLTHLADYSNKDKPWDKHRAKATEVEDIYHTAKEEGLQKYATRINQCSPWLKFHKTENNDIKLNEAYFCKVRNCPVCQWRRALRWKAKIYQALPEIEKQYPAGRWLFLTLTLRNCHITQLRQQLKHINKAWDKLIRRKAINKNILGYIKSVEITKGKGLQAHPHLHILLFVKSTYFKKGHYINQQQFTEHWQSALNIDYKPIVHITAVKNKTGKNSMNAVIAETLKYSVKESDMTENEYWFLEYTRQTHKTRAISSGGVLKDLIAEVSNKEMIDTENEEEQTNQDTNNEFKFYWFELSKHYKGFIKQGE